METDVERYAWLVNYELQEAERATTPDERLRHEHLAHVFNLKLRELQGHSDLPLAEPPPEGPRSQ